MTWHLPSYLPNADIARTHALVAATGERRTYEFPGGGSAFWAVGDSYGAWDAFVWLPGGLRYLGLLYPEADEVVYVWNANPGALALPETIGPEGWTSGPMREAFTHTRTRAGVMLADPTLTLSSSVVSIEPSALDGEPALHLRYLVDDGVYEENMWFVDGIAAPDGQHAKGLRRQNALHAGVVSMDVTYAQWELRD